MDDNEVIRIADQRGLLLYLSAFRAYTAATGIFPLCGEWPMPQHLLPKYEWGAHADRLMDKAQEAMRALDIARYTLRSSAAELRRLHEDWIEQRAKARGLHCAQISAVLGVPADMRDALATELLSRAVLQDALVTALDVDGSEPFRETSAAVCAMLKAEGV